MKSPNNAGDRTLTSHLLSPNQASNAGTGFYLTELLAKRVQYKSSVNPGYLQDNSLLSTKCQQFLKTTLLTTPMQLIEHEEIELVPT